MNAQLVLVDRRQPVSAKKGTTLSDHQESGLIVRAKRGEEAAIGQLYCQHAPGIYGYIASRVGDPALADDLTSEAFLCALEGLQKFEHRGVSISAWLYRIAHDRIADHFRRQARRPTLPLEEEHLPAQDEFDQQVDVHLDMDQLGKAIERLTAEQHQVVLLRFVAGLKLQEIAYVMDKSADAVKMLQLRALTRLRQLVAQTS
ncbi:MAG: sigma-70 family RNA polymerase sigma factor [Anaerolineae bacterium]|nr:sigma-70 family RNA polymerase sigma factor [Anaerolineae bacterium]